MADDPRIEVTEGGVELPVVEVLTGRGAIFGKSGSGKSNTVGVIAEELLEQNFPLLIIDTDGEHYGLKEEYQLLHVGATGGEADAAVGPEHAEQLARLALEEGVPIILDVSEFIEQSDVDELVMNLVLALFRMERSRKIPFPIFLEEAHEFIEQTNHPDEVATALIKVAKRGRKRGLGLTVMSQRPANVNKDVVTQSDWSIWHKLTWPQDTGVVKDVLGPEYANAVQDLDAGEALLDADYLESVRTVTFKRKQTFDAGETPGLDTFERPELQPVDENVIESLRQVEEDADEADEELDTLKQERDRLRSRVEELETGDTAPDEVKTLRREKRTLEKEVEKLQGEKTALQEEIEGRESKIADLQAELERLRGLEDDVETVRDELRSALTTLGDEVPDESGDADAAMRDRVESLEAEVERLESENERLREGESIITIPGEYEEFYEHETVEGAIEGAIDKKGVSDRAVWATLLTIANNAGTTTYDEIAERAGYADNTQISRAATALESRGVIEVVEENPKLLDFNFDAMEEIARKNRMQEEMDQRLEQKMRQ